MKQYTFIMNGRNVTIRGEVARAHELYEGSAIDQMADYYAQLSSKTGAPDLDALSDEELSAAIEDGFKKEVIDLSGERVWVALFSGNKEEVFRLMKLPKEAR